MYRFVIFKCISTKLDGKVQVLLGRVALVAQRPIVGKLSRGRSVGLYVRACVRRSVQCIVENGGSDPDAVWHHRSDGLWIGLREEVLSGANLGRARFFNCSPRCKLPIGIYHCTATVTVPCVWH